MRTDDDGSRHIYIQKKGGGGGAWQGNDCENETAVDRMKTQRKIRCNNRVQEEVDRARGGELAGPKQINLPSLTKQRWRFGVGGRGEEGYYWEVGKRWSYANRWSSTKGRGRMPPK